MAFATVRRTYTPKIGKASAKISIAFKHSWFGSSGFISQSLQPLTRSNINLNYSTQSGPYHSADPF